MIPRRKLTTDRTGFTLIELILVVVIIGILAAMAIPQYQSAARDAKASEAEPLLRQISTLEERYLARFATYTTDLAALEGGPALATAGKYHTYSLAAHASGFCAVATPNATGSAAGLTPRSMDAMRNFYDSTGCS